MKKNSFFFLILPIFISCCDQFSRFNYENFSCGNNSTGVNEITLGKIRSGAKVKLKLKQTYYNEIEIDEVIGKNVIFSFKNKNLQINRETANLTVKEKNKVTIIECRLSKFKM